MLGQGCFLLMVFKHPCLKALRPALYPVCSASRLLLRAQGLGECRASLFLQVRIKLQWGTVWGNLESFLLFQAVELWSFHCCQTDISSQKEEPDGLLCLTLANPHAPQGSHPEPSFIHLSPALVCRSHLCYFTLKVMKLSLGFGWLSAEEKGSRGKRHFSASLQCKPRALWEGPSWCSPLAALAPARAKPLQQTRHKRKHRV